VLQNETALAQAESNLLMVQAAYDRAEVEMDRATGLLVEHAGIVIAEAERGKVSHAVSIPHVGAQPSDQVPPSTQPPQR
jgi:hypothetical protein